MTSSAAEPILEMLRAATGFPAARLPQVSPELRRLLLEAFTESRELLVEIETDAGRYFGYRFEAARTSVLVLGPFCRQGDRGCTAGVLDPVGERQAVELLPFAGRALAQTTLNRRRGLALVSQREMISSAVIAISSELTLEAVLRRIVDLSREVAGARYAALGVPDGRGGLAAFLTSGLSHEEEARIGDLPEGRGILGLLLREPATIRLADLSAHPASVGFPPNHPSMKSFLGVPITARGRVLGNLYLTEKRGAAEFTDEDEQLVELLARHAAIAIEHAQLYRQVELQQQRLQVVIDQLPEAILLVASDPEQVRIANRQASAVLGWEIHPPIPLEDFVRRNPRFTMDGRPIALDQLHVVLALRQGRQTVRQEIQLQRPDGRLLTLLVNAAPLRDLDGHITSAVVVFQDISQIKDAERLKDDFLSLVSHELRTPLTTIHGGAHMLLHDGERLDRETQTMLLTDIVGESRRLATLVENTVQLANIRAGRLTMETEPVHVRELIERVVESSPVILSDRPVRLALGPGLVALGDAARLEQVLRNLLSNAAKYSPAGSAIEISARSASGEVVIGVRDHGPGLDPETQEIVFERFQRGQRAERSGVTGMGLGLYLCKQLVEAHGGRIWIEQPEDGGTRVLFAVPRLSDEDER